ncbi:MAG: AMP-binding protein [Terrimicrobiaceae bacterium]|nr:AMP-binding protein [Terrimicrobiaceae bacterium]
MPGPITPRNIAELFRDAAERFGDSPGFASRKKDGSFSFTGFRELHERAVCVATGLIDCGVEAREHVGLLADNRLEWILCDGAVQLCGAADVPRGTDVTECEIRYILEHAETRIVFVENAATLDRLRRSGAGGLRTVIVMDPAFAGAEGTLRLAEVEARGRELRAQGDRRVETRMAAIQPGDLFTLIYTSGTTGTPKGVQLTHANMVSQVCNLPFSLANGDGRALSILPIWHSYERVFAMICMSWGICTYYTTLRHIAEDLRTVRPTVMASAPRLWESLYQKIFANVEKAPPPRRALFNLAYRSAVRVKRAHRFFLGQQLDVAGRSLPQSLALAALHLASLAIYLIPYRVLDHSVLKKLRAVVGGEFLGTISGGGALQPHVDEFFNFIGIPVLEGYGLTETAPVLAVRTWKSLVIGTVGPLYPETEIRIIDLNTGDVLYPNPRRPHGGRGLRGEIHAKGPQIMVGYYKDPEGTARVLKDGWLNTGDIGLMTFNGCLKIVGRSKDTIVLLSGENVEPLPIENRLTQSALIDQCMVVGQDQKFLGALVVPHLDAFRTAGLAADSVAALEENSVARSMVDAEIRRLVAAETGFKAFERIVAWRFVPKPFEVADELTATLKLRRHIVTDKYAPLIAAMFA